MPFFVSATFFDFGNVFGDFFDFGDVLCADKPSTPFAVSSPPPPPPSPGMEIRSFGVPSVGFVALAATVAADAVVETDAPSVFGAPPASEAASFSFEVPVDDFVALAVAEMVCFSCEVPVDGFVALAEAVTADAVVAVDASSAFGAASAAFSFSVIDEVGDASAHAKQKKYSEVPAAKFACRNRRTGDPNRRRHQTQRVRHRRVAVVRRRFGQLRVNSERNKTCVEKKKALHCVILYVCINPVPKVKKFQRWEMYCVRGKRTAIQ